MSAIFGYVGNEPAKELILTGMAKFSGHKYDSCGLVLQSQTGALEIEKMAGSLKELSCKGIVSHCGFFHLRWATHGSICISNAHPLTDCKSKISIAHNGLIENYQSLKSKLQSLGHEFVSETDSEVIAHLIEQFINSGSDTIDAFKFAISQLEGTFAIAMITEYDPETIYVAKNGSPLFLGESDNSMFVSSDASVIGSFSERIVYLDDQEYCVIKQGDYSIGSLYNFTNSMQSEKFNIELEMIEKGKYDHFMCKEIFEQPSRIEDCLRGRMNEKEGNIHFSDSSFSHKDLFGIKDMVFIACGSSWHAALIGNMMIENLAKISSKVEYASEFRYRQPVISESSLVILLSQSGETADTLASLRRAKELGAKTLAISNAVGSTIAREADSCIYTHSGLEIGVASTKGFTSQIAVLSMLAVYCGRMRKLSIFEGREILDSLKNLPQLIDKVLKSDDQLKQLAQEIYTQQFFLFLGRGFNYPIALEGALKLKEVAYLHADGMTAGEMKHGPIALIDENMYVVVIIPNGTAYDKITSNLAEIKARQGKIIAIGTEGNTELQNIADHVIYVPLTLDMLTPILTAIPIQLFAYHLAVFRGMYIDQPRNLAKSVTVE
ncbi:MAG: glutamine--fructose-6-phosphate transaminase (isomerizing) [Candidatus Zixiibacteriota bacterium]